MSADREFVYRRPKWGRGMITADDARFLNDLVLDARPKVSIELGVASGCSSVTILDAMARYRDEGTVHEVWLHAFDVSATCYFSPSRDTGAAVAELTPQHLSHFRFTVGDVLTARRDLTGLGAPFAFIDANHLHPWATADLLGLLPTLAPAAWVAVHDIRLPHLGRPYSRGHGPGNLFDTWPGEKRQGGSDDNIGALRLPTNLDDVPAMIQASLRQPWEVTLPEEVCEALALVPCPPTHVTRGQALRILRRAADRGRPLYICGAGQAARNLANDLRRRELSVAAFVDRETSNHGSVLDGVPVEARHTLSRARSPRPFIAASGTYAREIESELMSGGWIRDEDYVVF